jgi:two-component system nitrate/nitrite response regulator NarL
MSTENKLPAPLLLLKPSGSRKHLGDGCCAAISVLIVEADPMRCQLMASAFKHSRQHLDVVACASDSEAALSALKEREADVAAISANLRDGPKRGLEVVRRIRTTHPKTRVVVLFDYYASDLMIEAFREGADGVVCREDSVETLCKCVRRVNEGQVWIRTTELRKLLEALRESKPMRVVDANGGNLLSGRQEQIVRLVVDGLPNREIANRLHLSEHTVKNYLYRIFDKLGLSTRVELVLYVSHQRERIRTNASEM